MFKKRYGCVASIMVVAVAVTTILYCTRYESKERGLRLQSFRAGTLTFDAWSYGNWETSHDGTLTIETYSAPYTLLLAVGTDDSDAATVEILQVALIDNDGERTSVLSTLSDRVKEVKMRPGAIVRQPYAVFCFSDLLNSYETITLEVEIRVVRERSVETVKQQLTIPGYEKVRRSFTFWEALMSV
jgi:hypothetical protein